MGIRATLIHNGLIWAVVPESDLPRLVDVLSAGLGTVEFTTERDHDVDEWRVLEALLVEPGDNERVNFQVRGRLLVLTGSPSALSELASAMSETAAGPKGHRPGLVQLRLVFPDRRVESGSEPIVFELG